MEKKQIKNTICKSGTAKWLIISVLTFFSLSTCGKDEEKTQNQQISPELQQAIDTLNKIDPQTDTVEEIIQSYKNAKKTLSQKIANKTATVEEKYVFFLSDSFLLFHQLIKFFNTLAGIIIGGDFDTQSVIEIINALPQSPKLHQFQEFEQVDFEQRIQEKQEDMALPYGCSGISGIAQTLCSAMDSIFLKRMETGIKILREIQAEVETSKKDFRVNIKSLPVKIQLVVLNYTIDFGGEHDLGTVYFFESGLNLLDSIFRMLFSVNIDLTGGIMRIPSYVSSVSITEDILLHAGRIFSFLLINNTRAFTVASTLEVKRARAQILESIAKIQKFIDYVKEKNVDSQKAIIYYSPAEETYNIRYKLNGDEKEVAILKEADVKVFSSAVEKVRKNLEGTQPNISTQDLIIIVVTSLVAAVKSGIFDPVIEVAINVIGKDQAVLVRRVLDSQLFTPGTVSGLISGVLGDIFYFDIGTMFKNLSGESSGGTPKTNYREWFPAWTTNLAIADFKNNLIIEWDCGAKLYDDSITNYKQARTEYFGLSCTQPKQDIKHFENMVTLSSIKLEISQGWSNLSWFLNPDEIQSDFPYILFQDPSFGGLILIKGQGIARSETTRSFLQNCGVDISSAPKSYFDSREAGNCALNTSIQSVIGNLLSSLSQ
ncbi:MAG: hypothetical protein RMJ45_05890 [Candidatus Calescibacterium sp.]|nr:hypothetical protein [Candidatus Calescibacterium sp.]